MESDGEDFLSGLAAEACRDSGAAAPKSTSRKRKEATVNHSDNYERVRDKFSQAAAVAVNKAPHLSYLLYSCSASQSRIKTAGSIAEDIGDQVLGLLQLLINQLHAGKPWQRAAAEAYLRAAPYAFLPTKLCLACSPAECVRVLEFLAAEGVLDAAQHAAVKGAYRGFVHGSGSAADKEALEVAERIAADAAGLRSAGQRAPSRSCQAGGHSFMAQSLVWLKGMWHGRGRELQERADPQPVHVAEGSAAAPRVPDAPPPQRSRGGDAQHGVQASVGGTQAGALGTTPPAAFPGEPGSLVAALAAVVVPQAVTVAPAPIPQQPQAATAGTVAPVLEAQPGGSLGTAQAPRRGERKRNASQRQVSALESAAALAALEASAELPDTSSVQPASTTAVTTSAVGPSAAAPCDPLASSAGRNAAAGAAAAAATGQARTRDAGSTATLQLQPATAGGLPLPAGMVASAWPNSV